MLYDRTIYRPAGDQAVVVEVGNAICPEANRRVRNLTLAIERAQLRGVYDLVPTYRSLLVYYDPLKVGWNELVSGLQKLEQGLSEQPLESPRLVHIPTFYGGEYGPDLDFVAEHAGLTPEEVVKVHSGTDYLVYMIGFSPGFPYLGGLDRRLVTPRLETPRTLVPAGSVGIAEAQTGIYPSASPGGWRLIGRTPVRLFDAVREPPSLLSAGDYLRFVPLEGESEYEEIQRRVDEGTFEAMVEPYHER